MEISQTGVGTSSTATSLRPGVSLVPVQAHNHDAAGTTFRVLGRVHPDAPWLEIIAPGNADFIEAVSFVPYFALEVTAGSGTVNLWIAEQ